MHEVALRKKGRLTFMKLTYTSLLFSLILSFSACNNEPEEPLILQEGEITDDFHKEHIGQINFMADYFPYEDYSEKDFLSSIQLNEKTNLNMRTYLGKTIAWYLHKLEPELSVEDLCAQKEISNIPSMLMASLFIKKISQLVRGDLGLKRLL